MAVRGGEDLKKLFIPLHFIRHRKIGGVENSTGNLLRGLERAGFALELQASVKQELAPDLLQLCNQAENCHLDRVAWRNGRILRRIPERYQRFVLEFLSARRFSGSVEATIFPNYFCPPVKNPALGRKICIINDLQHKEYPEFFSLAKRLWLEISLRSTFRYADEIIFISDATLQHARRIYGKFERGNWRVVHTAVSWENFSDQAGASGENSPYILSVAHHFPHKNLQVLIQAFARISGDFPDHMLVLCGQPKTVFSDSSTGYEASLGDLVDQLGLSERVRFTGFISQQELGDLYSQCDLFAFPSMFEGFGLPPVEAMGLGRPVLVSDIPVLREVTLGRAGYVGDYRSAEAWSEALKQALMFPPSAQALAASRKRVRDAYDPKVVASALMSSLWPNSGLT